MRLYKGIISSGFPAPIRFPVRELAVDAKELMIINNKDEMLRTIFVMAKGRSPRCSILTKKTNHVEMEMNDWIMLVTALGGIEGIKQLVKWWMSRKTNARIEDAHADVEEFKALREYNEFLQKQLSEKEQRFVEQTDRLRKAQDELFTLKETNSDLKLELALKRCERKKCGDREPQNGY